MVNDFEVQINRLIARLKKNNMGIGWKNHPYRTFEGKYLEGELFDYTIITQKKTVCFDAKQTHFEVWNVKPKDIKQAFNLKRTMINKNIDAFFLIYFFQEKKYGKLSIENFFKIIKYRKYVKFEELELFKLEKYLV